MAIELGSGQDVTKREDDGITIELRDAVGEPWIEDGRPVTVTVAGSYSKRWRKAEAETGRRFQKIIRRSAGEMDTREYNMDIAAQCVLAWTEFTEGGKPASPSRDNVLKVFGAMPWVYEQVWAAAQDHAAFFSTGSGS